MVKDEFHRLGVVLITQVVQNIVDHPEEVRVTFHEGDRTTVWQVLVAKEDMGQVLGKQGKMIQALRTFVRGFSCKHGFRTVIEVLNDHPPGGRNDEPTEPEPTDDGPLVH